MGKDQQCDFRSAVTRTERKPHHSLCLGNSRSARVLCELSQEIFLVFNFLLCSLTCEMYVTLQWCFSAHRDKGKDFWVFFFWLYWVSISCMAISLFQTSGGYSLLAGCMASSCGGFFCCVAPALGTRASVVSLHRLSICPSA